MPAIIPPDYDINNLYAPGSEARNKYIASLSDKQRKELGIRKPKKSKAKAKGKANPIRDQAIALFNAGTTDLKQVAEQLNITVANVRYYRDRVWTGAC